MFLTPLTLTFKLKDQDYCTISTVAGSRVTQGPSDDATVVVCEVRTGQGRVTLLFAPGLTNWPRVTRYKLGFSAIF